MPTIEVKLCECNLDGICLYSDPDRLKFNPEDASYIFQCGRNDRQFGCSQAWDAAKRFIKGHDIVGSCITNLSEDGKQVTYDFPDAKYRIVIQNGQEFHYSYQGGRDQLLNT